jgi:hypothetical protein
MNLITILLFFIYLFGLGFTVTAFIKNSKNFFERNLMRLGIGLATFTVLAVIINLLRIPLDWKSFLILSIIYPTYYLIKNYHKFDNSLKKIKLKKSNIYIFIVLLFFLFSFHMYHKGAFTYPYLEDDDPWEHARLVKYISIEKTAYEPDYANKDLFRYTDPYPPSYDILMAILYQTNDSINWTLKFFNVLIISLSIIMFYFFTKEFMKSKDKALISTFVLTVIPCYLSHFIWAHSMIPLLFFVSFYCLERINKDKKWTYVSSIIIASIFVVHPSQSIKFVMFFSIYFLVKWIISRKIPIEYTKSIILGGLLSLSWWSTKVFSMFRERIGRISHLDSGLISNDTSFIYKIFSFIKNYFTPYSGSATRPYTINDFFIAKHQNMINNPVGVGLVLMISLLVSLFLIFLFYKKYVKNKKTYIFISIGWLLLTFMIVNSATFNTPGLISFRTWMLFAIPLSIIVGEGLFLILSSFKSSNLLKFFILVFFIIGAILTSGSQKYSVNTAMWPPGASWTSMEEIQLYLWLNNLPKGTNVMTFSGIQDNHVIGLDMNNCDWCEDNLKFRKDFINKTSNETYIFFKNQNYKYLILDSMSMKSYSLELGNKTQIIINNKFQEYVTNLNKYKMVFQNKAGVILQIV